MELKISQNKNLGKDVYICLFCQLISYFLLSQKPAADDEAATE